ncbi:ribonuclease Z [Candidatus Woesearchaeota archaeon]|jgi:ribonuclease Z|nr:ribonuclease Z [Candidatus Woesearchaeota archaeon]MBT4367754.1 ribonuclease Z [Candidatus Woesearchaeota archaeon]MBT4712242.1 ribonuclease Z [Candidatus Woesearchaeota archaeon]MBT6638790.1 ribonuclease Z [Candidatus Woesearchaeota archaeon]MBT7134434.1 ribonuclease Z [Candidatus Woesearchaeota archaeon]
MKITFLGTGCMVPTKERNHPGIFVKQKTQGILLDCGENIQRQLKIAGIKNNKITKIFISHWHGDHSLGLPGLLNSMSRFEYNGTLEIYGPKGTKKFYEHMNKSFESTVDVEVKITEIEEGIAYEDDELKIIVLPLEHGVPTIGIRIEEKDRLRINNVKAKKLGLEEGPLMGQLQQGKDIVLKGKKIKHKDVTYIVEGIKIAYISDTVFCKNTLAIAKNVDLLIAESTFESSLEEKAEEYKHMTAQQAATVANKANVKQLVLTHFSQRYKDITVVLDDAKQVFDNTIAAKDFMKIKL